MLGHTTKRKKPRPFKNMPQGSKTGGSKPGKAQGRWLMAIKVVADAAVIGVKGAFEDWYVDRNLGMPEQELAALVDGYLPGWRECVRQPKDGQTPLHRLLANRVHKQYHSGTSDRGPGHDPRTRATMSREHWTYKVPQGHPLWALHEKIRTGLQRGPVANWKSLLLDSERDSAGPKLF